MSKPEGMTSSRWMRALVEFVVIVVGVLVALAVDQMADERDRKVLERNYVERLTQELRKDTIDQALWLDLVDAKERSLERVAEFLASPASGPEDDASELEDIATGTQFAWNVAPLSVRATYDDLRGSGNLGLISDGDVRFAVVRYYYSAEERELRIAPRVTEYPDISYRLFRRAEDSNETLPEGQLPPDQVARILAATRASTLGEHVAAEINRARFIRVLLTELRAQAVELLSSLETYAQSL